MNILGPLFAISKPLRKDINITHLSHNFLIAERSWRVSLVLLIASPRRAARNGGWSWRHVLVPGHKSYKSMISWELRLLWCDGSAAPAWTGVKRG